jgi:hypothetical protein
MIFARHRPHLVAFDRGLTGSAQHLPAPGLCIPTTRELR